MDGMDAWSVDEERRITVAVLLESPLCGSWRKWKRYALLRTLLDAIAMLKGQKKL